jgi:hypothetical protein
VFDQHIIFFNCNAYFITLIKLLQFCTLGAAACTLTPPTPMHSPPNWVRQFLPNFLFLKGHLSSRSKHGAFSCHTIRIKQHMMPVTVKNISNANTYTVNQLLNFYCFSHPILTVSFSPPIRRNDLKIYF